MSEKKINVKLLETVKAMLREEPRRLRMETVADKWESACAAGHEEDGLPPYREEERPPCGAVMCIAGHANYAALLTSDPHAPLVVDEVGGLWKAQQHLGLTDTEAARLFYFKEWGNGDGWPEEFEDAYLAAEIPQERAEITCRRIDHFINTNGAE